MKQPPGCSEPPPGGRSRWTPIRRLLRRATGLHECPACRCDMVCPVHWHPVDAERWAIVLRCGECGLTRDVVASNAQAAAFDDALDERQRKLERELARLDAERMAADVDVFVAALDRDLIDPADFRP
ncbi:MAG: hypothetical protein ACRDK0_02650 [Solirubrobacteraceae bacterium]